MPVLKFTEWLPDQAAMSGGLIPEARNVRPEAKGYGPFPSLVSYEQLTFPGTKPLGLIYTFRDSQGEIYSFVGTATKLYRATVGGWADATRILGDYNTPTGSQWRMVQWGDIVYAVNNQAQMQRFQLGASTNFEDVDIGIPVTFGSIFIVRDFLVGVQTKQAGLPFSFRVHWSAFGNPELFTPDPATQADSQDIPDLGNIQGGVGGEQGLLALQRGAVRMTYVGPPQIFEFDAVERSPGCIEPNSIFVVKQDMGYLSEDGWQSFNGTQARPIGAERVDRWFYRALDLESRANMVVTVPIEQTVVYIAFPGLGSSAGQPNTLLFYDYVVDRWSYAQITLDTLGTLATAGQSADDLDAFCDDIDALCDSNIWGGGDPFDAVIWGSSVFAIEGPPLPAVIETEESSQEGEILVTEIEPMVTGALNTITAQIATRTKANQSQPRYSQPFRQERNGVISCRERGRFPRVRLNIEGDWTQAVGVRIKPAGVSKV